MKRRTAWFLLVLGAGLLWAPAPAPSPAEAELPPLAAGKIAQRVVAALEPAAGERAVLVYDPTYYAELARAIEAELYRADVYPIVALTHDLPEGAGASAGDLPAAKRREDEMVALLRPIFAKADVFFWLPARRLSDDVRWERLLEASPARGIHFHWIFPLAARSSEEVRLLTQLYQRAILETDYAALSREQDRLTAALRGQSLRLTSPGGTALWMRVPRDAWFHKNDGVMSPARARQAHPKAVRDREMEFPAGALRFIPAVSAVEGKLVVPRVQTPGGVAENVVLEFERGRVVRWRAEKNEAAFRAHWQSIGGDVDKVGEIVLGVNPLLVAPGLACDRVYFGYGAGCVRVSLGDNWESGGANRSPGRRPLWLFVERATLEAGGRVLIRDGKLVDASP